MTDSAANRLHYAHSPAGVPIAECELEPGETSVLSELAAAARAAGAHRLCVYSTADLSVTGFEARLGYRRLTASSVPRGTSLPVLDAATVRDVWPRAFIGQWGHHLVRPGDCEAVGDAVYVGLPDGADWLGVCRAEPARRYVDGPGFVGPRRSPDAAQSLVLGACAYFGPGPVTLETWGDHAEPYLAVGFSVAEECPGWELTLT